MFIRLLGRLLLAVGTCLAGISGASAAKVTAEKSEAGAVVKVDGQPFTEYVMLSNTKPVLYPLIGPTGKNVTRVYPIVKDPPVPGEKPDHPHHRSFWFTHGDVNGVDFWAEEKRKDQDTKLGLTKHREFKKIAQEGDQAVIVAVNDWLAPDGKKVCEDERTLTFGATGDARWIDFDIAIKATDGDVVFGDTKEGCFGVRVAGTMSVENKEGGKIVNSQGDVDQKAWGKAVPWCDYFGPVQGETLGIAIFNHPSSFRFPTYWHARTYGLFTANPFGVADFTGDKAKDGAYTLESGKTLVLRYRVLLHKGDDKAGHVAEHYAEYEKVKK